MKKNYFYLLTILMVVLSGMSLISCEKSDDIESKGDDIENKGDDIEGKVNYESGHEYVDLGLSVKWATCNVGADKPEESGYIFAWGETTAKTTYNWGTYNWCQGSQNTMTKYCTDSNLGIVDNKTTLETVDDAATANWGGTWRMPTYAEMNELLTNCGRIWTTQNGVNGYRFTCHNGNSIFLPAAGFRYDLSIYGAGSYGTYWSSSLDESRSYCARSLYFDRGGHDWHLYLRSYGFSVRPVTE